MDSIVEIPPFRLDRERGLLLLGAREIRMRRRTWDVLLHLVSHAGRVVGKQELLRAAWADVVVSEQTLSTSIAELRKAFGDDARSPRFIETVHGRGFRFLVTPVAPGRADASCDASVAKTRADFVGRAEALSTLGESLSRAARGQRELVLVCGETGVGKTELALAFESRLPIALVGEDGVPVQIVKTQGQCVEFTGPGEAYMPFIAALRLLTRGPDARRVISIIRRLVPRWMAEILGAEDEDDGSEADPGRESRTRTLRLLVETLEELARDAVLILVIEDLQWSDPSTLELLDLVTRRRNPARLFLVGTLRSDETPARADAMAQRLRDLSRKGLATLIELSGLATPEIRALVEHRLGSGSVHPELVASLQRWTDGNPFLLDELLAQLRSKGRIVEREGVWELDREAVHDAVSTPPSVRAAVQTRTSALTPPERAALEAAAVFGTAFELEAVAAATAREADGLDLEALEVLCRRLCGAGGLIVGPVPVEEATSSPPDLETGVFGFRHALFAQALRLEIPPSRLRRIHRAFGEWGVERSRIPASVTAHHFEHARDWPRALECYSEAARSAKRRQADPEAIALFRSALRCLEALLPSAERDELELTLRVELGGSILGVSGYTDPEIVPLYLRVRELASRLHRPVLNMVASGGLFFSLMSSGRILDGHAEARRLLEESRVLPPIFEDIAKSALGVAVFCLGHLAEARALLEREPGREAPGAVAFDVHVPVLRLGALATVHAHRGDLRRGRESIDEMLSAGRSTGRAYDLANAHRLAAEYGAVVGDAALAREHAETTIELADEYGFGQLGSIGRLFVGWADARSGTPRRSLAAFHDAIEDLDRRGYRLMRSTFCARWAEAALEGARPELALQVIEDGLDHVGASGEVRHESDLWRLRATSLRMLGDASRSAEAGMALDRALSVAREQGALLFVLRALTERTRWPGRGQATAREALRAFVSGTPAAMAGADLAEARHSLAL